MYFSIGADPTGLAPMEKYIPVEVEPHPLRVSPLGDPPAPRTSPLPDLSQLPA